MKYSKNERYMNRNLSKGLCEKCPNTRAEGSKRLCERHLLAMRKRTREYMRVHTQGGVHIPEHPDFGYKDAPCKGIQHNQPQISQREWMETPFFDKWMNAEYEPAADRFDRPTENFFGSSNGLDPLEELIAREESGESIF